MDGKTVKKLSESARPTEDLLEELRNGEGTFEKILDRELSNDVIKELIEIDLANGGFYLSDIAEKITDKDFRESMEDMICNSIGEYKYGMDIDGGNFLLKYIKNTEECDIDKFLNALIKYNSPTLLIDLVEIATSQKKREGINVTKIEDTILQLANEQLHIDDTIRRLMAFMYVKGVDITKFEDFFIAHNLTNWFYKLAAIPKVNEKKLLDIIIKHKDDINLVKFADIGISKRRIIDLLTEWESSYGLLNLTIYEEETELIRLIQKGLLTIGDGYNLCAFALREKTANLKVIEDKLIEIKDYESLFTLAKEGKYTDIKKIEQALLSITSDDVLNKVLKNTQYNEGVTGNDHALQEHFREELGKFKSGLETFAFNVPDANATLLMGKIAAIEEGCKGQPAWDDMPTTQFIHNYIIEDNLANDYFDYKHLYEAKIENMIVRYTNSRSSKEILTQPEFIQLDCLSRVSSIALRLGLFKDIIDNCLKEINAHQKESDYLIRFRKINLINDIYSKYDDLFVISDKYDTELRDNPLLKLIKKRKN